MWTRKGLSRIGSLRIHTPYGGLTTSRFTFQRWAPGDVYYASGGRVSGDEVIFADGKKANLAQLYQRECPAERKARDFPLGLTDTFALAQYEWLQAVRERRPPETSGRDALASLACAFTVLESAEAGRRVEVAEVLSGAVETYQRAMNEYYRIG